MTHPSDRLKTLLADKAVIRGRVTLSSGAVSEYYFDCRRVTLSAEGAPLVADAVLNAIVTLPERPRAIGGLTHGADPIIMAAVMAAGRRGQVLDGFFVRKEAKKHGTQNLVENAPPAGTPVVIVDDVVTKGGSVVRAIDGAESAGCRVVAVVVLVDRMEGGAERIQARVPDARYLPVYTLEDFFYIDEIRRQWAKSAKRPSPAESSS
jgi:orotate phosphoribosyltransferase